MRGVYLLHFSTPYQHAQHYIGWADNISRRVAAHRAGTGGRLPHVVQAAAIEIACVRTWSGADRTFERRLKNRKNAKMLCPICNPDHWRQNAGQPKQRKAINP